MRSIPLRAKYPEVYKQLTEKLDAVGLHAFDVKADILLDEDSSETLSIQCGKAYKEACFFKMNQGDSDDELIKFLNETVKKCQKQAVEDYYAYMDIRPAKG